MKTRTWHKFHKVVGLAVSFFLMMFCVSGILLNHKSGISHLNVDRSFLPSDYQYTNWNKGLLRGTLDISQPGDSSVLFYGSAGIWQLRYPQHRFFDYNQGLPQGMDLRNIRSVGKTTRGDLFAVSDFRLYRQGLHSTWRIVPLPEKEQLSDLIVHHDTLIVVGKSHLFLAKAPYKEFRTITLKRPSDYEGRVPLYRVVRLMHSGELLGKVGEVLIDIIAFSLLFLLLSGWFQWLSPWILKGIRTPEWCHHMAVVTEQYNRRVHEWVGRKTILFTLFIAVTGWMLRPPMMVPLTVIKVPAWPGILRHTDNPWNDRLHMLRHDCDQGDWMLAATDGFYSLKSLDSVPQRIKSVPSVSVMGLTVFQKDQYGNWLIGTYSGMFLWNRYEDLVVDYQTGDPVDPTRMNTTAAPNSTHAVSGYISSPSRLRSVVEYESGTDVIMQPKAMNQLPVSLRFWAQEVHTGRIYTLFANGIILCVCIIGLLICWIIWSGWKLRYKK